MRVLPQHVLEPAPPRQQNQLAPRQRMPAYRVHAEGREGASVQGEPLSRSGAVPYGLRNAPVCRE